MGFDWRLAVVLVAVFASGCVIHHHGGTATPQEEEKPSESQDDTISKIDSEPASGDKSRETQKFRSCPADLGLAPGNISPSMPQVVKPEGVEIVRTDAKLVVDEDGGLQVEFDVVLKNETDKEAKVRVGYAWRVMRGGPSNLDSLELGGNEISSCSASSDPKLRVPFKEYFSWTEVAVAAGDDERVSGSIAFNLDRRGKSESLFGFEDGFSNNWKNFDWPYTKAAEYAKIAKSVKPYASGFRVQESKEGSRVSVVGARRSESWIRSYSYEQMTVPTKDHSSVVWALPGKDGPRTVSFEFNPELSLQEERAVFEKIVAARPDDLRAKIHLADLLLMEGDHEARVKVLIDLLEKWEKNAKAQLLISRNDVRGPAYVALVVSLKILKREKEARKYATEGLRIIEKLSKNLEMNRLSRNYLESAF